MADLTIDIFDSPTTTENSVVNTTWEVSSFDATVTSESVGYYTDAVSVQETVNVFILNLLEINVTDTTLTFDSRNVIGPTNVFSWDNVTAQDILQTYPDLVIVNDLVVQIDILNPFSPIMRDDIVTSESVSVSMNSAFGPFNPKKRISEITDPQIIRIERL